LFDRLHLYKLRSKVEILNLSNEFVVAVLSRERFMSTCQLLTEMEQAPQFS